MIHRSRVDWWLAVLMSLPVIGGVFAIASGLIVQQGITIVAGVVALGLFSLLIGTLMVPLRYVVEPEQLLVRSGMIKIRIPWERLTRIRYTDEITSGPALSMKRLAVEFDRPGKGASHVLISPVDRDAFLRDVAATSKLHTLDGQQIIRA